MPVRRHVFPVLRRRRKLLVVVDVVQTHVLRLPDPGLRLVRCSPLKVTRTVSTGAIDGDVASGLVGVLFGGNDVSVLVHLDTLGGHANLTLRCSAVHNGLPCTLHDLQLSTLAANTLKSIKVVLVDRRDVLAAEDTDLEFLRFFVPRRQGSTSCFKITQSLVDDSIGANLLSDLGRGTVVSNELGS